MLLHLLSLDKQEADRLSGFVQVILLLDRDVDDYGIDPVALGGGLINNGVTFASLKQLLIGSVYHMDNSVLRYPTLYVPCQLIKVKFLAISEQHRVSIDR